MLNIQGIDVNIGATPILRGVSLEVPSGTMCGLIGRNVSLCCITTFHLFQLVNVEE